MTLAIDCESKLIEAGRLDPDLVCVSTCGDTLEPSLYHHLDSDCHDVLEYSFKNEHIVGQNFAFDAAVIGRRFPDLLPLIFQAYFEDRVVDTRLNQRLIDLARGELEGYRSKGVYHRYLYSLNALSIRHGFGEMEKDEFRLKYGELIDVPLSKWSEGQKRYALLDAQRTREVYGAQLAHVYYLDNATAQARAAFALHLMSCRGIVTSEAACQRFIEYTKNEITNARLKCTEAGIVREVGSRDTKAAKKLMLQSVLDLHGVDTSPDVFAAEFAVAVSNLLAETPDDKARPNTIDVHDITVPITKTGGIRLDAEACRDSGSDVLRAYSVYSSSNSLLDKAETLLKGTKIPLQSSFEPILETGRISSRAPSPPLIGDNFLNLRTAPGLRECMIPREGFYWCSIDINFAELCAWSQVFKWLFGYTKMGDAINKGLDPHCILAADLLGCSYEEALAKKKEGAYKVARDNSKAGNFGYLANMGPRKLAASVNKKAKSPSDKMTEKTAALIKHKFVNRWDAGLYYKWGQDLIDQAGGAVTFRQFVSGRIRGNCNYKQLLNSPFQGLIADALKEGLLQIAHECYVVKSSPLFGCHTLLHLYDENILEVRQEQAHEAAFRARDIMLEVANNKYLPDVNLTADPALSLCWSKAAQTVFDEKGRLIPDPEVKVAA